MAELFCDFCRSKDVKWRYPCETFTVAELYWISEEDWAACDDCSEKIEKDDWVGLIEKVASKYPLKLAFIKQFRKDLHLLYAKFREMRKGGREEI